MTQQEYCELYDLPGLLRELANLRSQYPDVSERPLIFDYVIKEQKIIYAIRQQEEREEKQKYPDDYYYGGADD